jgi:general secretion pathway protein D
MMAAEGFMHRGGVAARLALLAALMTGCAGYELHEEGLSLLAQGQAEEGLIKLEEASLAEPDNMAYRADLLHQREQTLNRMLDAANSQRAAGNTAAAKTLYDGILRIDASNSRARLGLETLAMDARHDLALKEAEALLGKLDVEAARAVLRPILLENPQHGGALQLQRKLDEAASKAAMAEPTLKTKFTKPVTLQFRDANLKMVFEALSRTSGINVLLDRDVKPDLKTSIFVKEVSVEDTINLILMQNQLEKKVISDNTVFIYPSTPAKLKDYQDLKIRSFHLTNADPKQILTMIKTLLKTKDIFIHEKTNSIVMRDTPDAIRLAEKMVADQDIAEPEVMLEVEVLEVSAARMSELGIRWPSSFGVATPDGITTLGQLKDLDSDDLLVTPLSATLNLKLDDTATNILASPRIRVRNREKARVMIGSRVPVITNAVTPVSTGTPVITGSVQYLDVGLQLEVEPDIHLDNEVVIKVKLDVSNIIKQVENKESGTIAYEVGTRNANTVLRLKDGETQILAGLINDADRKAASKVPGLGQIPVLGRLFSNHTDDRVKSEIVLSITPRIVGSASLPDGAELEYWAGTESNVRSGLLNIKPLGSVAVATTASATPALRQRPLAQRKDVTPVSQPPAADGPVVLSWQGPARVRPGDQISLTLNAQSQQALNSLDLVVSYDASVLRAVDVVEGGFFKQGNTQSVLNKTIDQTSGQIQLDVSGGEPAGTSGSGSLITLLFEAIAASPQTQVVVGRLAPAGAGGEALTASAPDPHFITVLP